MVISFMLPGIGCIFPFLPLHMRKVGLTAIESQTVSAVAPLGKMSFHCQLCQHLQNMCSLLQTIVCSNIY